MRSGTLLRVNKHRATDNSRDVCCLFLHGLAVSTELIALTEFWVADNNLHKSGQHIQSLKEALFIHIATKI